LPSDKPLQRLTDILETIDWIVEYAAARATPISRETG
jgi:hypothetical protein